MLEKAVGLHKGGDLDGAAVLYQDVLARDPRDADALHFSGLIAYQRGDHTRGWDLVQAARALRPRSADIAYNLGRIALALHDWPAAVEANRAALALTPTLSAASCNLGIALTHEGQVEAGEAAIRRALETDPGNAATWSALGLSLHHQAKDDEARAAWQTARHHDGNFAEATFNLATSYLRSGDFVHGWPLFAARAAADPASFTTGGLMPARIPLWQGEALNGRTLLVWGEQGLGDQILFAGFLRAMSKAKIILACAPRLVLLFQTAFPRVTVLAQDEALRDDLEHRQVDVQISLADLGRIAWPTGVATTPRAAFLRADPARAADLRRRYQAWSKGGPLVGVSWHSRRATLGAAKSLPLTAWAPVLDVPGATFVSLQYGETEADLAQAGQDGHAVHADPDIDATHDLPALSAQIAAMDLVISVSNTTAHLAGALGVPTWILAPTGGGSLWYWFHPRNPWQQSPWYPALRVYHQDSPGQWRDVLHRVRGDLSAFAQAAES